MDSAASSPTPPPIWREPVLWLGLLAAALGGQGIYWVGNDTPLMWALVAAWVVAMLTYVLLRRKHQWDQWLHHTQMDTLRRQLKTAQAQADAAPAPLVAGFGPSAVPTYAPAPAYVADNAQALQAAMDLADQRQTELQHERALFGHGPVAVLVCRTDDRQSVVYASGNVAQVLRLDANLLHSPHWSLFSLVHPDDLGRLQATWAAATAEAGKPHSVRYRLRPPGASWRWVEHVLLAEPAANTASSDVTWVRGYVLDVDDQVNNQQALGNAQKQLEHIGELSLTGYWEATPELDQITLSPYLRSMLGFEPNEMWGFNATLGLFSARTKAQVINAFRLLSQDNESFDLMVELTTRRFKTLQVRLVGYAVVRAGQSTRFVGSLQDITAAERLKLELQTANQAAQAALEAKSTFLANMSHEIRTPLNGVMGLLQLLSDTHLDETQSMYIDKAHVTARSLMSILTDILDFSKIEANRMALEMEPFAPDDLLKRLDTVLAGMVINTPLQLHFERDPKLADCLLGDMGRLLQVLVNLGSNAVKFTPSGHIGIRMVAVDDAAASVTSQRRQTVRFEVQDTGVGISAERLPHIFEKFNQGELTQRRIKGGTGLGLPISESLVELMGSRIEVQSELGVGSVFAFNLVLPVAETQKPVAAKANQVEDVLDLSTLMTMRILCVEDNPVNQLVVLSMLENMGLHAQLAENGMVAVQMVQNAAEPFDIVLMDLQMPDMDGIEATKMIRSIAVHQPVIIAMTANVLERDKRACRDAGMNGFMGKPFVKEDLIEHLKVCQANRWLNQIGEASEPQRPSATDTADEPVAEQRVITSPPGWDVPEALHRLGGRVPALLKALDLMQSSCDTDLSHLQDALHDSQWANARQLVHRIKGSARMLSAHHLANACDACEPLLREQTHSPKIIDGLQRELNHLLDLLEALPAQLEQVRESLQS